MNLSLGEKKSHDDHGEYLNRPGGDQRSNRGKVVSTVQELKVQICCPVSRTRTVCEIRGDCYLRVKV